MLKRVYTFLTMIKFSHTLFALPFALGAAFTAARGLPDLAILGKVVLAVVFARTAAMSFNRYMDRDIDAENARTADRALPRGELTGGFVLATALLSTVAFVLVAAWINQLTLYLSPIVVFVILGYSLTKRFTALCHVILGLALALAPIGAWIAVTNSISLPPFLLGAAVLLWTAGFDVLYACMDTQFDRQHGLHSIPVRFGIEGALRISALLHVVMIGALAAFGFAAHLGSVYMFAVGFVLALLVYEHRIVKPNDLSRVNRAFFATNGIISMVLMGAMITEAVRT